MTPATYAAAIEVLRKKIGEGGKILTCVGFDGYPSVKEGKHPLSAEVWTSWPYSRAEFRVVGDNLDELLVAVTEKWESHYATWRKGAIQRMALEIIRITADKGECTDAALRGTFKFSEQEVAQLGAEACVAANQMAGRGPFTITPTRGANGAPAAAVPA